MQHPYEYNMLTNAISFQIKGIPTPEQERLAIAQALSDYTKKLTQCFESMPDGSGWEIKSHSVTLLQNTLLLSILLQRPRIRKADR